MTSCDCNLGYYMNTHLVMTTNTNTNTTTTNTTKLSCERCPEGANCDRAGLLVADVTSLRGWWRDWNQSDQLSLTRCVALAHCVGGKNQCADNREGTLCTFCYHGYSSVLDAPTHTLTHREKDNRVLVLELVWLLFR